MAAPIVKFSQSPGVPLSSSLNSTCFGVVKKKSSILLNRSVAEFSAIYEATEAFCYVALDSLANNLDYLAFSP